MIDSFVKQILIIIRSYNIEGNSVYAIFYLMHLSRKKKYELKDLFHSQDPIKHLLKSVGTSDIHEEKIKEVFQKEIDYLGKNFVRDIFKVFEQYDEKIYAEKYPELFDAVMYSIQSSNREVGVHIQPKPLTKFMNSLATDLPKKAKIYNPFGGFASFGAGIQNEGIYYGEEIDKISWAVGYLRLKAHNINSDHFTCTDSIIELNNIKKKYDLIISSPPFGSRVKMDSDLNNSLGAFKTIKLENLLLKRSLSKLEKGGQLIVLLSSSFLFEGGATLRVRKWIVKQNFLDKVISLPAGAIFNTGIRTTILVIKKDRQKLAGIEFIDGKNLTDSKPGRRTKAFDFTALKEGIFSKNQNIHKIVRPETIKDNDFNLSVSRYIFEEINFAQEQENSLVLLKSILKFHKRNKTQEKIDKSISIKDLSPDILDYEIDFAELKPPEENNDLYCYHNERSEVLKLLLIAKTGIDFKSSFIKVPKNQSILISPQIAAFEVQSNEIEMRFLIFQFEQTYFKKQFDRIKYGAIMSNFNVNDFLNIKIYLPPIEDQKLIAEETLMRYVSKTNKLAKHNLKLERADVLDENSFLRHQIAGRLNNLRASFNNTKEILEQKVANQLPGLLEFKQNELIKSNLGDYLKRMERDIQSISKAVQNTGDKIALREVRKTEMDLIQFLKDYKAELDSGDKIFTIELDFDEQFRTEKKLKKLMIEADKDLLRKMFDNIFDNAEKHAFFNKRNDSNKIKFELLFAGFEDAEVQLDVCNTGKPLPENFSHEAFIRKGSTAGEFSGDGTGGWFINEVMKIHNGHFGFTDETGPESIGLDTEYVTSIELTFPLIL